MKVPPKKHRKRGVQESALLKLAADNGYISRKLEAEVKKLRQENELLKDDVAHYKAQIEPTAKKLKECRRNFHTYRKKRKIVDRVMNQLKRFYPETYYEILKRIGAEDSNLNLKYKNVWETQE